jgi:Uma2 family endonuclease
MLMSTATTSPMTAEEFFEFCSRPENRDRHFELEEGEVVEMPQPGERHGVVCANLVRILGNFTFQRRKGYVCGNDTGLILQRDPDTVRGPDVILYDEQRRYADLDPGYCSRPPKLVVEVVSPTARWLKVLRRVTRFLSYGIALVWVVDPEERSVVVYRANQLPRGLDENEELTGEDILPDFRCRVADFFYMPGEEAPATPPAPAQS